MQSVGKIATYGLIERSRSTLSAGVLQSVLYIPVSDEKDEVSISRSGAVVARLAHNQKVASSNLASATNIKFNPRAINYG